MVGSVLGGWLGRVTGVYNDSTQHVGWVMSLVGAIVGELPVGSRFGMGVVIINAAQYYNWRPANLWAAIAVSSASR